MRRIIHPTIAAVSSPKMTTHQAAGNHPHLNPIEANM
jgi:hypothetical protein